jgi:nicotinate-nucleotide--dimethylbenzimidazole phosphoribosyltransferase
MQFDTLDDIRAFCRDLPGGDERAAEAAALRQQNLTKPPGSLGRLEELAIWLARWQACELPRLERVTIAVFAGNHGVADRGVSAYPQAVTEQMVANFAAGGAAINQIATLAGAELRVVPIELDRPTRDFTVAAAMDTHEFSVRSMPVIAPCRGLRSARRRRWELPTRRPRRCCAALLGGGAARWAGRGTGVDDDGLARKRSAIDAAPEPSSRHSGRSARGGSGARRTGARRDCRCGSTARRPESPCCLTGSWRPPRPAAGAPCGGTLDHCRAGHVSADPAMANCCATRLAPLLDLNMRLGEASGAGVAILLLLRRWPVTPEWPHLRKPRVGRGRLTKSCRTSRR